MPSASSRTPGRAEVVPGQPPHDAQVGEGVGLAQPVAEVAGDAQRFVRASAAPG